MAESDPSATVHITFDTGPVPFYFADRTRDEFADRVLAVGGTALHVEVQGTVGERPTYEQLQPSLETSVDEVAAALPLDSMRTVVNRTLRAIGIEDVRGLLALGSFLFGEQQDCGPATTRVFKKRLATLCPEIPWYRRPTVAQLATFCRDPSDVPLLVLTKPLTPGVWTVQDLIDGEPVIRAAYNEYSFREKQDDAIQFAQDLREAQRAIWGRPD
jgi:hypothetical protein